ncbi:MAG: type II toxin-antitoxin system HicB family antitoxin [Lachnospiraceae bacterium]|nr:type II toxin-antitoxin system HicB family antitoxin [Lachnospiraceae bacterium]
MENYSYLVILHKVDNMYLVYVPDFDINTEGYDLADALTMAKDAITETALALRDSKRKLPLPGSKHYVMLEGDIERYVEVDIGY